MKKTTFHFLKDRTIVSSDQLMKNLGFAFIGLGVLFVGLVLVFFYNLISVLGFSVF